MAFTLIKIPGFSDLPDAALAQNKFSLGHHVAAILGNTKFGTVRPEFFYTTHVEGETVPLPVSPVDGYKYSRDELLYQWSYRISANPEDGKTSAGGTILFFDTRIEQIGDTNPGLVHIKTVYHVQGGATEATEDGKLNVETIAIRGKGILSMTAAPAWLDQADTEFDLDSVWKESRAQGMSRNAKRSVVQAEVFDLGEFTNGQTVPLPVSPLDGYTYAYTEISFMFSWRWSPAASGSTTPSDGKTISRLKASVNATTGVVSTEVTYRLGASTDQVTTDGKIHVLAYCFRSGLTVSGTVSFTDIAESEFSAGKKLDDTDAPALNQNAKFASLRPEFFVTSQAHGSTVALPTGADGYAYARAELFYLYVRDDTGAPSQNGSLLTLRAFVRQDTGAVVNQQLRFEQGGAQTTTTDGTLRVLTVGLRSRAGISDSDEGASGGPLPGNDGEIDNDLILGGGQILLKNPSFGSGDRDWTKGTGFTIENDPANAYDGNWVGKFVGSTNAALRNSVTIPISPNDILRVSCFVKRTAGDGSPAVRISWLDASKVEISTTTGNVVTSSTYALSRLVAHAPAGTFFARVESSVITITVVTTAYFDQFNVTFFPISAIDIPRIPGGGIFLDAILAGLSDIGNLLTADRIDADGATFARVTLNERTGGTRGFSALDALNKLGTGTTLQTVTQLGDAHDRAVSGLTATTGVVKTDKVEEASIAGGIVAIAKLKTETVDRIWASSTARDDAVDSSGNLKLKNVERADGVTSGPSTTSSSFVDLTDMTKTLTTKGNDVLVVFHGTFQHNSGAQRELELRILRGSSQVGIIAKFTVAARYYYYHAALTHIDLAPSAGSHTYKVQWKSLLSNTWIAVTTNRELEVVELG